MMSAVGLSQTIVARSATTMAMILGTIASVMMVRFWRFRGANGFEFMITALLVIPDVITGLLLLFLFVALGHSIDLSSDRGMLTIWLVHVTFCTVYVVVSASRLRELALSTMDLGSAPLKVFFVITLPIIMPAVVSGWLLVFTLSLDELVITSFVSGTGVTTLPTLILGVVGIVGFIAWYLMVRVEKQRMHDIQRARHG